MSTRTGVGVVLVGLWCAVILGACVTPGHRSPSLAEDMGSPRKIRLLEEKAAAYWQVMTQMNVKKAYTYYDPFLRARMSVEEFVEKHGVVKYHKATVTGVKVEGNIGTVKVKVTYSVPKMKVKEREFSVPETTEEFEERWLFVYDDWYKEYYLRLFETSAAYY